MATVEDLVRALSDQARVVVPAGASGTVISGVAAWEPERSYPPGFVLFGVGVAAQPLFEQQCVGLVLRDPGDHSTRMDWQREARQRGVALLLIEAAASWTSVIRAATDLITDVDAPSPNPDAIGEIPAGDLFALADAFAGMVGGPIIIEDADFRVLSYSTFTGPIDQGRNLAILGRQMPPEWRSFLEKSGNLKRLRNTDDVVDLASGPWQAHRRLITAVREQGQVLGIIWAAEGDRPLPPHADKALGRAARTAVPHMRRHQEGRRAERARRGDLVRSLLDGRGLLHRHAVELGLPRDGTLAVLAFAPMSDRPLTDEVWDRITDHVALSCEAFRWHAAVARVRDLVFAVVALPDDRPSGGVLRLGRDIISRSVPTLKDSLCGAMSTTGPELARINERRLEAQDAIGIVRSGQSEESFVAYETVQPQIILRELAQTLTQREDLRLPGLIRLAEEDARRGSDFTATLLAYLRSGAQASATARELGIHVTTLRYRLGRITDISNLELNNPEVRLACQLLIDIPSRPNRTGVARA